MSLFELEPPSPPNEQPVQIRLTMGTLTTSLDNLLSDPGRRVSELFNSIGCSDNKRLVAVYVGVEAVQPDLPGEVSCHSSFAHV